jgi:hypothetical protein
MEHTDLLRAFRRSLYACLDRRTDALFELTDAILTADAAAPSPAHLSLQPPHRRGWASLYAALMHGRIDEEALRDLLARHPLAGSTATPVYAVDVSVWDRCDAEASPERGFYYHPSRHSAGQPIVAGWAYQFVAQLNFVRESWSAPVDVRRVRPAEDANVVAAEQIGALLSRLEEGEAAPLFVFDAGYDPVKVQQALEESPCQILVRLRAGRSALIGAPGPSPRPSTTARTPVTDLCACGRGPSCTRRSRTTRGRAAGDPCPSWSAHSSWSRSSACPAARGGASLGFCGYGGTARRGRRRTSISCGART